MRGYNQGSELSENTPPAKVRVFAEITNHLFFRPRGYPRWSVFILQLYAISPWCVKQEGLAHEHRGQFPGFFAR